MIFCRMKTVGVCAWIRAVPEYPLVGVLFGFSISLFGYSVSSFFKMN